MKKMTIQKLKPVLVFDVNETLLDMTPLRNPLMHYDNEQGFGSGLAYYTLLHYRIVSAGIMTLVLLGATLTMAATSMNRK
jgi:2-haloacid dehalogenase